MTTDALTRNEWWVKQGDKLGYITEQLLDETGAAYSLTLATGVKFIMRLATASAAKVDAAATIIDAANGIVRYSWTGTDTDTAGDYRQEWQVTFSGGNPGPLTWPNDGYNIIHVLRDLGS